MKKILLKSLFILVSLGLILACTKDVVVEDTFKFDFSILKQNESYLGLQNEWHILLTPEKEVSDVTYTFSYEILEGEGHFTEIPASENLIMSSLDINYHYIGTSPGIHKVRVTIISSKGITVSHDYEIEIKYQPFIFNFALAGSSFLINNPINITSTLLSDVSSDPSNEYTFSYIIDGGTGILNNGINDLAVSTNHIFLEGSADLIYTPSTLGLHTIKAKAISEDGNFIERELSFTVTNVPVLFSTSSLPQGVVNQSIPVNITITPQIATSTTYQLNYVLTQGPGNLNNSISPFSSITAGTFNNVTPGTFTYNYVPTAAGTHILTFVLKDSNNAEYTSSVTIEVNNIDFTLSTSGDGSLFINANKTFNTYLTQAITDTSINYQVRFTIASGSTGAGQVFKDGVVVPFGTFAPTNLGSSSFEFKGTFVGTVTLIVEVKDSNNVIHSSNLMFSVTQLAYNFTGAAQSNNLYLGETTPINFDLTEPSPSGTNYEMKYVFNTGNGNVKNGALLMTANTWYPVNVGSFARTFTSTQYGATEILFYSRNTTTLVEHVQLITINSSASSFTFEASNTSNNQNIGTSIPVNFILNQAGGTPSNYTMSFTSSGTGSFVYNGNTYTAGQPIPVLPGSFSGTYIGNSVGTHNIIFSVVNTSNPLVSSTDNISLIFITPGFNVSTSGDGSLIVNNFKDFYVYLTQTSLAPSITYQVRFTITSGSTGGGQVYNGTTPMAMGVYTPINIGSTGYQFKGTSVGNVNVLVEIIDSYGVSHNSTLNFNVNSVNYIFSGAAQSNNLYVGDSTALNFDITETSSSGTNYEMKYVFDQGTGLVSNGTTSLSANTYYPVNVGSFSRTFSSTTVGQTKMIFTVRNTTTLVEHTQLITIDSSNSSFTFEASNTLNNQIVGTAVPVNFNLNQAGGTPSTYTMTFTTSGTGTFSYNGNTYTAGQPIPVTTGSFNGIYTGSTSGEHNIVFSVTSSLSPLSSTSDTVTLNYNNIDFILSTSGDGSLVINSEKEFNVFLSQLVPSPSITYQVRYIYDSGTTGTGQVFTAAGVQQNIGVLYPINLGNTTMTFKALTVGNVNLKVEVIDSNNIIHSSVIEFENENITYNFTGAPQNNTVVAGSSTNLNFDITESITSGTNYQMKYEITQGAANILDGSTLLPSSTWFNVNVGSFTKTFQSTLPGTVKVLFTVRNTVTLIEQTQLIEIYVDYVDFTLSTAGDGTTNINSEKEFLIFLQQLSVNPSITYQVRYSYAPGTVGAGNVLNTSNVLQPLNQWSPLPLGNTTMKFIATSPGLVKLKVEVIDSNAITHFSLVEFNVQTPTFDFNREWVNMNTGTGNPYMLFNIENETITGDTYEIKCQISNLTYIVDEVNPNTAVFAFSNLFNSSTHTILFTNNTYYNVNNSITTTGGIKNFNFMTIGLLYSNFDITVTLKNSYGVEKTQTINYTGLPIPNPDFIDCYKRLRLLDYNGSFSAPSFVNKYRYFISYSIPAVSGATLSNVKLYGKLTGASTETLIYSGPVKYSYDNKPSFVRDENGTASTGYYEYRILLTYSNGMTKSDTNGVDYDCNGETCEPCSDYNIGNYTWLGGTVPKIKTQNWNANTEF